MAAQALVRKSYDDPIATIKSNTLGTASILDAIRRAKIEKKLGEIYTKVSVDNFGNALIKSLD